MKSTKLLLTLLGCSLGLAVSAQNQAGLDSTGLPGDHFSLHGALALFQKASTPEAFEKMLNEADNHVNNLDLNGDGETDYIRVIDHSRGDVHAFALQAVISASENQDVAVIELERTGDTTAVVQIVGDEEIYGEKTIVEPDGNNDDGAYLYDQDKNEQRAHGPDAGSHFQSPRLVVNVWLWPSVKVVYGRAYRPWMSPWRWQHYPGWWKPWRPLSWTAYRPFHHHHHRHFVVTRSHRVLRAHTVYAPFRVSSVTVRTRHQAAVSGYRVSRTRTTVTGPRGNQATRTKTTVRGNNGRAKATRTTVRKHR
ncbi:MAG: hypothetical protein H7Y42_01800 [Chitinophagaceae bacterium]|nr:hypothetical protein [Chitinophagaceae bacterium]